MLRWCAASVGHTFRMFADNTADVIHMLPVACRFLQRCQTSYNYNTIPVHGQIFYFNVGQPMVIQRPPNFYSNMSATLRPQTFLFFWQNGPDRWYYWPWHILSASNSLPTEFGSSHNRLQCMILYIVILFMSLQNSVGPYNTGTLYRSVERMVGHSVTWVCVWL